MKKAKFAVAVAIATAILVPMLDAKAAPSQAQATSTVASEPTRFSVVTQGRGPDVILIPGLSSPRDVWAATAASLKGCRVHLVQVKGFGEAAGANGSGPVLDPLVEELAAYIETNKLKNPAVIGHSMGGLAALMLGARHPDAAGKIMVVDAVPFIGTLFSPAATVDLVRPQADAMRAMMVAAPKSPPSDNDRPAQTAATMVANPAAQKQVAQWMRDADMRVVAQAMYDDMVTDARPELARITAPVTLLYASDTTRPAAEADASFIPQYKGVATFKAVRVDDSRHFIMLDQPQRFVTEVNAFLGRK